MNKYDFLVKLLDLHETDDPIGDIESLVNGLSDSYAAGYLIAKIEGHHQEDFQELKEDLEEWADYDIWKTNQEQ